MAKNMRIFRSAVALCLLACMLFSLAACAKKEPEETDSTEAQTLTYTIELKNQSGMALTGVGIYVYTDSTLEELVWFDRTDDSGIVTFTDQASDSYVAVLSDVPAGYLAEESYTLTGETTQIVLETDMTAVEDPTSLTYELGDVMQDFTVTAPDGTEYTLSELLAEKEAVVLNFWYAECDPCKAEFPYLQEAYEKYSDKIAVLALNPVDTDAGAIEQFQSEYGLTFPMALCDKAWEQAMQITGYPTTVVIDRYGTISLIHRGSIPDAQTFADIFAYFADEDFEPGPVEDIENIPSEENEDQQEINNPSYVSGVSSFELTVKPGEVVYCDLYKISAMIVQIKDADAYAVYNGKNYSASNGTVSLTVTSEDPSSPVNLGVGNNGSETKTFTISLTQPAGTWDNPYTMKLGEFSVSVAAGNERGVFYCYTATASGTLTLQCLSATAGVSYTYSLYNLNTLAYRCLDTDASTDSKTGAVSVSVKVNKGDVVKIGIGTLPDNSNSYPKGSFKFLASFESGSGTDTEQVKLVTYSVKVTDENNKALSGVTVYLSASGSTRTLVTDSSGLATVNLTPGTYSVSFKVPSGYTASTTSYTLTEASPSVTIKLSAIKMVTYTVKTVDESGSPVKDALVSIGSSYGYTNAAGTVTFSLPQGSYTAEIDAPEGYTVESSSYSFGSATTLTVTLKKVSSTAAKITYTVKVVDYTGKAVTGVQVKFGASATQTVNSSGVATASLVPGNYTVTLSGSYYYDTAAAKLTATKTSITIQVASLVGSNTANLYICDEPVPSLSLGATYVKLGSSQTNYVARGDGAYCFFVFDVQQSGNYQISVNNAAEISDWGSSTNFIPNTPYSTGSSTSPIVFDVKEENLTGGPLTYILAVKVTSGINDCVLMITRTGDVQLSDEEKAEWIIYQPKTPPKPFTLTSGGQNLTYVNLASATSAYNPVLGSDGYYHLNSATGPILYVNLGPSAPYLSFYEVLGKSGGAGGSPLRKVFYDADGNFVKKEDYAQCMSDYVDCRDSTYGVYPLTEDLKYIIQQRGDYMGWWDSTSPNYLFDSVAGLNPEIAWMFACCYVK